MSTRKRPLVMRIITRLAGGGPPIHVTLLNRKLGDFGFDSILVFGNCAPSETDMEYLLRPGEQVARIPELGASISPLSDLRALVCLWKLMREVKPDIVHTHTAKAGLLGRLAAHLAGCEHVVHTYHGHVLEGYFPAWVNRLLQLIEQRMAGWSDILCTVSRQQAEELSERFLIAQPNQFRVVPLGLDLQTVSALPAPDYSHLPLRLLWLGRFVPIKNLPLLLDVARLCQARSLPVEFLIAGDGLERDMVVSTVAKERLSNCEILPWQRDITTVMSRSDLLILTSLREGTPVSLIQGMAAGRPFLSTPAGGVVDLATGVCRASRSVWRYENASLCAARPEAFVEEIEHLLKQPSMLESMSRASRKAALHFSADRLASDIAALYRELLGPDSQPAARSLVEVNS